MTQSGLQDLEQLLDRITHKAVRLRNARDPDAVRYELLTLRAHEQDGQKMSCSFHRPSRSLDALPKHEQLQIVALEQEIYATIPGLVSICRGLSPAFDVPNLPLKISFEMKNGCPHIAMTIFKRAFMPTTDAFPLPQVIDRLGKVLSRLAGLPRPDGRDFMIDWQGCFIPARSAGDALRIHAALCAPDLFKGNSIPPRVMEVLDGDHVLASMMQKTDRRSAA